VFLVGTVHVSQESADAAKRVVEVRCKHIHDLVLHKCTTPGKATVCGLHSSSACMSAECEAAKCCPGALQGANRGTVLPRRA